MPILFKPSVLKASLAARSSGKPVVKSLGKMGSRNITADGRKALSDAAYQGSLLANAYPAIAAARDLNSSSAYRWGFLVGTGTAHGKFVPDDSQRKVRNLFTLYGSDEQGVAAGGGDAVKGFDTAQALQFGISKALAPVDAPANVAAGMYIAGGVAGSGNSVDAKQNAIGATLGDMGARAGASAVIDENLSVWAKVLRFFGL